MEANGRSAHSFLMRKNGPVLTLASFSAMVFKIYMEMNGRSAHSLVDEKEWASSYLGFILWIYIS
jgi:hypothetical protein